MSSRLNESETEVLDFGGGHYTITHSQITILKQLQNSSIKNFARENEFVFKTYNYKKEFKDRLYFRKLEFNVTSRNFHVLVPHENDYLYSTLDWKIKQLVEGGFFVHWFDRYLKDHSLRKPEPEPDDDKIVLTMDHLSVGFIIWFGMLLISSVAFIAELVQIYVPNYLRGILFQMVLRRHQRLHRNR